MPLGSPLPSSRKLAETLDVARNTVALAYQELVADGFLVAQERRGYFINGEILGGRAPAAAVARAPAARPDWERRLKLRPSPPAQHRQAARLAELSISLHLRADRSGAVPDRRLARMLAPGPQRRGGARLGLRSLHRGRSAADRADPHAAAAAPRRARRGADEILRHRRRPARALSAGVRSWSAETALVGIEDPGYADARNIFLLQTEKLRGLAVDDHGLVIDERLGELRLSSTSRPATSSRPRPICRSSGARPCCGAPPPMISSSSRTTTKARSTMSAARRRP